MYTFLNSVIMLLSRCQVNLLKYDLLVTCNARFYLCIWIITSRFASDITVHTVAELFTACLTEWESWLKRMLHVLFIHVLCTQKIKKNGCIGSKLIRWNESDIHLNIGQLILWGMKISKMPKPSWIDTVSAFVETYLDPFQCMAVKNGGSVLQKEI